jgi:hypothetical protein
MSAPGVRNLCKKKEIRRESRPTENLKQWSPLVSDGKVYAIKKGLENLTKN